MPFTQCGCDRDFTDLVIFDVHDKILVTLRIQIISQYGAALFRRRYCKWAHACKHVRNHVVRLERVHETCMLRLQPGVPIDVGEVKLETTVGFTLFRIFSNKKAE